MRAPYQQKRINERPHVSFRETVSVRFSANNPWPAQYSVLWESRELDVKARTCVQSFVSFRIVSDDAVDPTEGLFLGGRLVGGWASASAMLTPMVTTSTEFGGQVGISGRGSYAFPAMTANDSLATNFRFQFLGFASPPLPRLISVAFDGMLVAGERGNPRGWR